MSQPIQQPYQVPQQPPQQPVVRLPTWVNVVLVLILLASCSAANDDGPYIDNQMIANQVVADLEARNGDGLDVPASSAEVADLCRLLGALAAKEKVPLTVMDQDQLTRCHEVAQEAAATP